MSDSMKHPHIIGFTEAEAKVAVETAGLVMRISSRDGNHLVLTRDYRTDRLNVDLVDGKVKRAWIG